MISSTLGGIGLFLLGMVLLTEGLKTAAGDALRRILERFTGGPGRALLSGAAITMLVQSSSATTLATIGFVSAGLLSFPQAIGVVFGANLGTTSTGWIVSLLGLKLSMGAIALPLVGLGALARLLLRDRPAAIGLALAGFGLIFVGIDTLTEGMSRLAEHVDPTSLPGGTWSGRALLVAVGAAMSVVLQSSSAAVATTLAAVHAGAIGLDDAAALVIGQNVGTTVTAAIAAIGGSVAARRTALAHILFNVFTGAVAFAILPLFLAAVRIASAWLDLAGDAATIAAFHTTFNLLGVALLFPFTHRFAEGIARWVPERGPPLTRHLDRSIAGVSSLALDTARRAVLEITEVAAAGAEERIRRGAAPPADEVSGALRETRDFLSRVRTSSEVGVEHARHVSLLHAIDHVGRLDAAVRELSATVRDGPGIGPPAQRLLDALVTARRWIARSDDPLPATELESASREIAQERRRHRRTVLLQTAEGEITPAEAKHVIVAMRRLDQLAYHLWRALLHLDRDPAPSIASDDQVPDSEPL